MVVRNLRGHHPLVARHSLPFFELNSWSHFSSCVSLRGPPPYTRGGGSFVPGVAGASRVPGFPTSGKRLGAEDPGFRVPSMPSHVASSHLGACPARRALWSRETCLCQHSALGSLLMCCSRRDEWGSSPHHWRISPVSTTCGIIGL